MRAQICPLLVRFFGFGILFYEIVARQLSVLHPTVLHAQKRDQTWKFRLSQLSRSCVPVIDKQILRTAAKRAPCFAPIDTH